MNSELTTLLNHKLAEFKKQGYTDEQLQELGVNAINAFCKRVEDEPRRCTKNMTGKQLVTRGTIHIVSDDGVDLVTRRGQRPERKTVNKKAFLAYLESRELNYWEEVRQEIEKL